MKKFKTNKKIKLACSDYNKLLDAKKDIDAEIAKVQREKDLEVDTINKFYENKLDKLKSFKNVDATMQKNKMLQKADMVIETPEISINVNQNNTPKNNRVFKWSVGY